MLIERFTLKVKIGCKNKVIELAKAWSAELGVTARICSYVFGPYEEVIWDLEFESEEDRRSFWDGIDWSLPALVEWAEAESDILESGRVRELLRVH